MSEHEDQPASAPKDEDIERFEKFEIRFVREAPVESIVSLYQAGGWWQESPEARSAIPKIIRGSFAFAVILEPAAKRIVGMGRVLSDGVSDAYIQDVVLLPEFRGRGLGKALVTALIRRCTDCGIGWIGLICAPGTQGFYDTIEGLRPMAGFQPRLYQTASAGADPAEGTAVPPPE